MDNQDNLVRVQIFGQEYTVKAPADQSYIKNIAEYVDSKMREVEGTAETSQSTTRTAILAAMNISDELFNLKKQQQTQVNELESRIAALLESIDQALADEPV